MSTKMSFFISILAGFYICHPDNALLEKRSRLNKTPSTTNLRVFKHPKVEQTKWRKWKTKRGKMTTRRKKTKPRRSKHFVFLMLVMLFFGNGQRIQVELLGSTSIGSLKRSVHVTQTTGGVSFQKSFIGRPMWDTFATGGGHTHSAPFGDAFLKQIKSSKSIVKPTYMAHGAEQPRDDGRQAPAGPTNIKSNTGSPLPNNAFPATGTLRLLPSSSTSQTPTRTIATNSTTTCTTVSSSPSNAVPTPRTTPLRSLDDTFTQRTLTTSNTVMATPSPFPRTYDIEEESLEDISERNETSSSMGDAEVDYVQDGPYIAAEIFGPQGRIVEDGFLAIDNGARYQQDELAPAAANQGGLASGLSTSNPNALPRTDNDTTSLPANGAGPNTNSEIAPLLVADGLADNWDFVRYRTYNRVGAPIFNGAPGPEIQRLFDSEYYCPIVVHREQNLHDLERQLTLLGNMVAHNGEDSWSESESEQE